MDQVGETGIEHAIYPFFFYFGVFAVAEISRQIIDSILKKTYKDYQHSDLYAFLIEFIAATQMCTCVYENGIIVKHYGWKGFGLTVVTLLFAGGYFNRGAFVNPLGPLENIVFGSITPKRFVSLLAGEILGGFAAFPMILRIWYITAHFVDDHYHALDNLSCTLNYKIGFKYVMLWEVFGCFVIRMVVHLLPNRIKSIGIPALVGTMLSIALVYVGVPGLNPLVASSRLFGCYGLDEQWFVVLYLMCPAAGWLSAAYLIRLSSRPQAEIKAQPQKSKKGRNHYGHSKKNKRKAD